VRFWKVGGRPPGPGGHRWRSSRGREFGDLRAAGPQSRSVGERWLAGLTPWTIDLLVAAVVLVAVVESTYGISHGDGPMGSLDGFGVALLAVPTLAVALRRRSPRDQGALGG
jgi:hypothetical protein